MASEAAQDMINSAVSEGSQVATALLKLLNDLANDNKKQSVIKNDEKMVKAVLEYQKSGGKLIADDVGLEYAGMYEQLLRNKGVPFVASTVIDKETGKERVVFSTRERDALAVSIIRDQFKHELGYGLGEVSPDRFVEIYANQDVTIVSNITPVEKEILAHNLVESDISYAFNYDKKSNRYTIMVSPDNEKKLNDALKLTAYDLSGERGDYIRKNVETELDNRKKFEMNVTPVQGQTIYVVDAANPSNFIAVSPNSYSYHSLRAEEKELEDGTKQSKVRDMYDGKTRAYNKAQVIRLADRFLQKPVVLNEREMEIVSSINANGNVSLDKNFDEKYPAFAQALALRKSDLKHRMPLEELVPVEKTFGFSNIPEKEMQKIATEIEKLGLKHVSIEDNQIAYTLEDKRAVDAIIESVLYSKLSLPERFEMKCRTEDRGEIDIDSGKTYLIKDMKNPGFQFKLDEEKFTIYNLRAKENGIKVEPIVIDRISKQFEETVVPLLNSMQDPVVLNEKEISLPYQDRAQLEMERKGDAKAELAKEQLMDNSQIERENLVSQEFSKEEATKTQIEALDHYETHWPKQTYKVDRTLSEKIADHTIEQKTVSERARKDTKEPDRDR